MCKGRESRGPTGPISISGRRGGGGGGASVDPDGVTARSPSDDVPYTRGTASWIRNSEFLNQRAQTDAHKSPLWDRPDAAANPASQLSQHSLAARYWPLAVNAAPVGGRVLSPGSERYGTSNWEAAVRELC